jgi:Uncharacterised nucleotidyltransferase
MHPLLLECARARPDLDTVRRLAASVSDWSVLVGQATRHGVASLVSWYLNQACPEGAPAPLGEPFRQNAGRTLLLTAELLRLLDIFEAASIPLVPFKGPALAWSLYETPALREMSDLDVLVRPRDANRAIGLLRSHGYRPRFSCVDRRFFAADREMHFDREDGQVAVDLHWGLLPRFFPLDASAFFERLAPVPIAGRQVLTLCPEDLLLFLCVHGSKHGWTWLGWLCDVARLIDRCAVNWDDVLARAQAGHVSRCLSLGLTLARDLLGAAAPELRREALAASVREQLMNGCGDLSARFQLALLERLTDKVRFWQGILAPRPEDFESLHIPASLFPAYYLAKPLRLAVKHGLLAARRLLPSGRMPA